MVVIKHLEDLCVVMQSNGKGETKGNLIINALKYLNPRRNKSQEEKRKVQSAQNIYSSSESQCSAEVMHYNSYFR